MKRTLWLNRNFLSVTDNGLYLNILERVEGSPARLKEKLTLVKTDLNLITTKGWSIKKETGHLADLEPLWYERAIQILEGKEILTAADMTNRKTYETDYDTFSIEDILHEFEIQRNLLTETLRNVKEEDLLKSSLHPRLNIPMKLIDLAFFVSEHDDHHLATITQKLSGK